MKKFFNYLLLFMCVLTIAIVGISVHAADVTTVDGANYRVGSVINEKTLDFGVEYHNDLGYSQVTSEDAYTGYVAGSDSYGNSPITINSDYSQNLNVLEVPTSENIQIVDYCNIDNGEWNLTNVRTLIGNFEEENSDMRVIGAINGDFFDIRSASNYPKTTIGGVVSMGENYKVTNSWKMVGFKNDGSTDPLVICENPEVSSTPTLDVYDNSGNVVYSVDVAKINDVPSTGEVSAYFAFRDEEHNAILTNVNDAWIIEGDKVVPYSTASVYGKGEITQYGSATLTKTTFAVVSNNDTLNEYLEVGATVRVQYNYTGAMEGIQNNIGYSCNVLVDGAVSTDAGSLGSYRHPRTMLGVREDGTIIMATVDGRQVAKGYYGACVSEQAAMMKYYGCTDAFNLDGGGSTTMVIKDDGEFKIVNSPSDGRERSDGNCLLICAKVPKVDINFTIDIDQIIANIEVDSSEVNYGDLYIEVNDEMKKIGSEAINFSELSAYTDYIYKIYYLEDGEYKSIPYSGVVNTAKTEYSINRILILANKEDKTVNELVLDITDTNNTIVYTTLIINGNKYYPSDQKYEIPKDIDLASATVVLEVSYNLVDGQGEKEAQINDINLVITTAYVMVSNISEADNCWVKDVLNK